MSIRHIGLCMLREIPAQGLHPLPLHPDRRDSDIGETVRHWEPTHARRFHQRLDGRPFGQAFLGSRSEPLKILRRKPEADRLADRGPVIEDLCDLIAANGQVNSYRALPARPHSLCIRIRRAVAQPGLLFVAGPLGKGATIAFLSPLPTRGRPGSYASRCRDDRWISQGLLNPDRPGPVTKP